MQKVALCVFATIALASSAALLPRVTLENRWSVLRCENGNLSGTDTFVEMFKNVVDDCGSVKSTSKLFNCIVENLGVTEEDGTPSLEKLNDFYTVTFSELILQDLPELRLQLDECAQNFVASYNVIEGGAQSSESFFQCFTLALGRFGDSLEDVCRVEEELNPGFSATRL